MKKLLMSLLFVSLIVVPGFTFAKGNTPNPVSRIQNIELIEQNLLIGLNTENAGLQSSSAYMLGEIKSEKSVIPLMRMLRNNEDPHMRIMAALALYKIGDSRGIWAVKQAVQFDDNECVRKKCNQFFSVYTLEHADE